MLELYYWKKNDLVIYLHEATAMEKILHNHSLSQKEKTQMHSICFTCPTTK